MPGRLAIAKLSARCIVDDSPQAASIADRAIRALRDEFPDTARRAFGAWLDRPDESVWIVRRLDLAVMTAADVPTDMLASSVVMALGRALGESLSGEGDGFNAIRFPNRAAYLGQFVSDMATGDAWSRWYYRPFNGLHSMTASAAIRTALAADPRAGLVALAGLSPPALTRVTGALASPDEQRLLVAFASGATAGEPGEQVIDQADAACLHAWKDAGSRGFALRALLRAGGASPPADLVEAIRIVAAAIEVIHGATPTQRRALMRVVDRDDWRKFVPLPIAAPLSHRVVRRLVERVEAPQESSGDPQRPLSTRAGGLCLLLRDLDDLPWDSWTAALPAPPVASAAAVLRWLTLVLCAGRTSGTSVFHDEAIRSLFGIPPGSINPILGWLRRIHGFSPLHGDALSVAERRWLVLERRTGVAHRWCQILAPASARVLRSFAGRLPGFPDATPEYLWRNFVAFDADFEPDTVRIVVKCARPPLHVVLMLTGMTRGLCAGHAPDGRPLLIFTRD